MAITIKDIIKVYNELPNIYYKHTHDVGEYYRDYDITLYKENGDIKVYSGNDMLYFCNKDVIIFVISNSGTCYNADEYFSNILTLPYMKEAAEVLNGNI